ncbi:MAG: RsmB/NOP family class I SAM-dependent RNA methyltransferase [Pseudomonadota bacterium]
MRPPGRVAAAIEIIDDIRSRHRPAPIALADWARAHRFAGAGDRAAIGTLVFDALRRMRSSMWIMEDETARGAVVGMLAQMSGGDPDAVPALFDGSPHAADPLTSAEVSALGRVAALGEAPAAVQGDVPDWAWPHFEQAFDDLALVEARALAARAPVDLRANTLKASQDKVVKSLSRVGATASPIAQHGVRLAPPPVLPLAAGGKQANVQNEAGFQKGWFEIQDEASQIAAALVFAQPGEQILDLCAGGGGKTLALAAAMQNRGQLFAYDNDRSRLAPIHQRLKRAGVRNTQVRSPSGEGIAHDLADLVGRMDRVLIDAPCSGSGTWRRRPDAKWRASEANLEARADAQRALLDTARDYVRPGGYLCYVTCSLFAVENEMPVHDFIRRHPDFELVSAEEAWRELYGVETVSPWSDDLASLRLTPAATQTDGFYFAVLERRLEG